MKKALKKAAVILLVSLLFLNLLSACSGKDGNTGNEAAGTNQSTTKAAGDTAAKAEPVKLSIMSPSGGRIIKEDNPALLELQKVTNTELEILLIPDAEYYNKLNAMVASGDAYDMIRTLQYDVNMYVPQGVFTALDELIDQYGPNIKRIIPEEIFEKLSYQSKVYGIPSVNYSGKLGFSVRKDWMEALQLTAPKTLDEFYEVLKAFKAYKPEAYPYGGYEFNQTSPFLNFSMIFGAYGIQPAFNTLKDGKIHTGVISQEYKEGLKFIKKLFDEKLIDPEILIDKADQGREKLLQGKLGSFTAWWSIVPTVLMEQYKMKEVDPNAEWLLVEPVSGPGGDKGMMSWGDVSGMISISTNCKEKEAAVKFLDYLITDDGYRLVFMGIKDVHWTADKDGKFSEYTAEGKKAMDEKWLDPLSGVLQRTDIVMKEVNGKIPLNALYIEGCNNNPLYGNVFEGIVTSEMQTLGGDVTKLEIDRMIEFLTGAKDIDAEFDNYVKQWKEKGGEEIRQSLLKVYNGNKGTNLVFDN